MISRLFDITKRLGELRDGMLVAGAVVYLAGYLTWSAYSWRERLGPVAPLDAQYFAAGTPITFAFVITIFGIIALRRFADPHFRQFFEKQSKGRQTLVEGGLIVLVIALAVLAVYRKYCDQTVQAFALVTVAYVLIHLAGATSREQNFFLRFAPPVVFLAVTLLAVAAFAAIVYETIPDSLGGGRPRRVTLDLRIDAVAPSTVHKLLDASVEIPLTGVIQTREIDLMTSQGDYYLILIPTGGPKGAGERIQLRRSAVEAISWR